MSTKLNKWHAGVLLAGLATLSIAILAALLPGWAQTQEVDTDAVSIIETAQDANNDQTNAAAEATTTTPSQGAPSQGAYEPATALVVEPGDSLWAIAQERLGPEATPQQVAQETGRIYELNRERIGEDPNLILVGQRLLMAPPTEGSTTASAAVPHNTVPAAPAAEQPSSERSADANEEPATSAAEEESATSAAEEGSSLEPSSEPEDAGGAGARRMLGLLLISLSLLVPAALAAWRLLMSHREHRSGYEHGYYDSYSWPHYQVEQRQEEEQQEEEQQEAETEAAERGAHELEAESTPQGLAGSAAAERGAAARRRSMSRNRGLRRSAALRRRRPRRGGR